MCLRVCMFVCAPLCFPKQSKKDAEKEKRLVREEQRPFYSLKMNLKGQKTKEEVDVIHRKTILAKPNWKKISC